MATDTVFPAQLDVFTQHSQGDFWAPGQNHTDSHNSLEGAVEAIEAKIGAIASTYGSVKFAELTFTETAGAGVYTGSVTIPAGSWLLEVIVHGVALWDNAGAVDMIVGDTQATTGDDNGIFIITSLKSGGDLNATQSISAAGGTNTASGEVGADIASTAWERRYVAAERIITGKITTASTGGSTGRTRMLVVWAEAGTAATATAATKV